MLLFFVGLGCFFDSFAYLRRRWAWALVLLVCCMGLLDIYGHYLGSLERNLGATAGGILGLNLNQHFFGECFGTAGATIIFLMLYFISLLFLTNFQLGEWVRAIWGRRAAVQGESARRRRTALERRARDLQKQARKLQDEVDRSGLGADMQPVPAPTVRDLSVPQPNKSARGKKPAQPEPAKEPAPADEVEVIPAREVGAATTADILGKKSESADKPAEAKPAEGKADVPPAEKTDAGEKASRAQARTRGAHFRPSRPAFQAEAAPETQAHCRRRHAHDRQLPVAAPGFPRSTPTRPSSPPSRKRS